MDASGGGLSLRQIRQLPLRDVLEDQRRLDVVNLSHRRETADCEIAKVVRVSDHNMHEEVVRSRDV